MSRIRSRDRPRHKLRTKDLILGLVALFVLLGILGALATLFRGKNKGTTQTPIAPIETIYSDDVRLGSGIYAASDGVLTYTYDGDYTASGYKLGFTPGNNSVIGGNAENSDSWTSVIDIDGNAVMELGKDSDTLGNKPIFTAVNSSGEKYVFETDFRWRGSAGGVNPEKDSDDPNWFARLEFYGDGTEATQYMYDMMLMYELGEDYFFLSNDHEVYDYKIKIKIGTWVNLRIEYTPLTETTADVEIFINGKLAAAEYGFNNVNYKDEVYTNNSFSSVRIEIRGYAYDTVLQLDNTYVSAIGGEETVTPEEPEEDSSDSPYIEKDNIDPNGWAKP